jgi:N-acetylmuramoyl-L-alanine amidase
VLAPLRSVRAVPGLVLAAVLTLAACTSTPAPPPPPPPVASTPATPTPTTSAPPATWPAPTTTTTPSPTTSARPTASLTAPPVARGRVVVLDPGHNGGNARATATINRQVPDGRGGTKACNTTGTETDAGYPEHAFTLDVARRVAKRLSAGGVRVVLTRDDDSGVGPCVDVRGRAGERADADAVVSIHADGAAPGGRGFHVAYADPPLNAAQRGPAKALADALRNQLAEAGFPRSTYIGRNGLSPRPDLAGLNLATRPSVLVECANMRNAGEAALVSSSAGRDRYAAAIADGILRFLA